MKQSLFFLPLLLAIAVCSAQTKSIITTNQLKPKAAVTNFFIYTPPKNLSIPDKIQALVIYQNKQEFLNKTININKVANHYQFSFKAPDSTSVLMLSIIVPGKIIPEKSNLAREKKIVFDNNQENGFVIYLHDKTGKRFNTEQTDLAELIDDYGYLLALKDKPTPLLIKMYEDSYRLHPELKKENAYPNYLYLLNKEKGDAVRPQLLNYANQLLQVKDDEDKWIIAARIYRWLKMIDEKKRLEDEILTVFPDGKRAKENYWNDFNGSDTIKDAMLATMNTYMTRFNDNSIKTKDRFYTSFAYTLIGKKDWATALEFGELVNEKMQVAYAYNYNAWKLSGKQTDNPGIDLEQAKMLSAKSISISTALMHDNIERDEDALQDLKEAHYNFYDTYALILYKLGQYDSAFYYQDLVSKQGKELNTGGMEKYAAYAEKVKGVSFTKQFIESKLLTGNKSPVMLKQLQAIYKQLNLPEDEFNRLQDISLILAKQKNDADIIAMYGSLKAPDFSLKNMLGKTITLSQLKNKIVVLDFWATWCGPCKANFPAMQQLVNKYKDDQDVIFLFVDTWESNSAQKDQEAVAKYMVDNKYSFNVVFDIKNKVAKDYKVDGIPKKMVLDKNGNLLYTGESSGLLVTNEHVIEDMSAIIDVAKKIPVDPNINKTKLPDPVFLQPKTKQK